MVKPCGPGVALTSVTFTRLSLKSGQRAEAAEQALGRDDERAVAGGQPRAGGDRADRTFEHELARRVLDRAEAELGGQRGGELLLADGGLPAESSWCLVSRRRGGGAGRG